MTLVKICGIREVEHALVAVESGADLLGLVFYPPSPRNVSRDEARAVVDAVRDNDINRRVRIVGLFVNAPPAQMNEVANTVGLDIIQLSGDEPPTVVSQLCRPAIVTLRVDSSGRVDEERRFLELTAPEPLAVLIDAHVPGMYGGTGTIADWFVATEFARRYPVILAGGLQPDTVGTAIRGVKPFAVDVSSGVETGCRKDSRKIRAFIANAREAESELTTATHGKERS